VRRSTGAIVCPGCRKLIEVNDPRCPYCGRLRPGLWGYGPALARLVGAGDPTALIIGASVLFYGLALMIDLPGALHPRHLMGILGPSPRALTILGMTGGSAWAQGQIWTVLSAIYLHGGIFHIVFNMMWVKSLGPAVEEIYGPARAFILFQVAGAAGFLVSNWLSGAPTVGASGAIFGLLAALIAHGRRAGRSLLTSQLLRFAAILFVFGFVMPGVNNLAHAGGFAGGWMGAMLMGAGVRGREGTGTQLVALASGILSLAAVVMSAVTVLAG